MPAAGEVQGAAVVERLGATAGEVAAEFRCQAVAGESSPAAENAVGAWVSGSERERFGFRESGIGEESSTEGTGQIMGRSSGTKVHVTECALLLRDLLAAKGDLRLSREIKGLARDDGLIIDDLGYLQQSWEDMEVM